MVPSHDDLLLEGHDEGWTGDGCCPNCTARMADCDCCPICDAMGRLRRDGQLLICPACEGEGYLPRKPEDEPL